MWLANRDANQPLPCIRVVRLHEAKRALIGALVIAEVFYKWHSFLLETGGFLPTCVVLDAAVGLAERALARVSAAKPMQH